MHLLNLREGAREGQREREGERENPKQNPCYAVSAEPDVGLNPMSREGRLGGPDLITLTFL